MVTDDSSAELGAARAEIARLRQLLDAHERRGQDAIIREMNHRLKNAMAISSAIVHQSFRASGDPELVKRAIQDRLRALAEAHDLLSHSDWVSADITQLVTRALAPYASADRLLLSGPPLRFNSNEAVNLALMLNELATNATKYGAWSNDTGRVDVSWSVSGQSFELTWTERDGPEPAIAERKGFGSQLLERIVPAVFGGKATLDLRPDGLIYRLVGSFSDQEPVVGSK
jgi:two-component sensor histidine kinase